MNTEDLKVILLDPYKKRQAEVSSMQQQAVKELLESLRRLSAEIERFEKELKDLGVF